MSTYFNYDLQCEEESKHPLSLFSINSLLHKNKCIITNIWETWNRAGKALGVPVYGAVVGDPSEPNSELDSCQKVQVFANPEYLIDYYGVNGEDVQVSGAVAITVNTRIYKINCKQTNKIGMIITYIYIIYLYYI